MTVDTIAPAPAPTWLGQATAVEQSRAVAEVAAAVQVARLCPRDVLAAQAEMRRACSRFAMADRAFYAYRRGTKNIQRPSVYLARELARIFGNMQWGIHELRREDAAQRSEMQAFAWDVEKNSRQSTTFYVPHARDVDGEIKPLESLRDVYENNANMGARRQREMILGLLPQWFVDEAVELCRATLRKGEGNTSLEQRIATAVEGFARTFRVDRAQLERHIGAPVSAWSEQDVADIGVVFRSLQRGETSVSEQFPTTSVTAADLGPAPTPTSAAAAPAAAASGEAGSSPGPSTQTPAPIEKRQWAAINERFREIGVNGEGQQQGRIIVIRAILDAPDLKSKDLTADQAQQVLDNLAGQSGVRLVADVLTREQAPQHLIPALPQEEPAPTEDHDPGHLEDAAAQEQHYSKDTDPDDDPDPYADLDPTVENAWATTETTAEP